MRYANKIIVEGLTRPFNQKKKPFERGWVFSPLRFWSKDNVKTTIILSKRSRCSVRIIKHHIRGGKVLSCNKTTLETSQNSKLLKIKYKIFMLSVVFLSAQPSSSMTKTLILANIKQSKLSTSSSSWRLPLWAPG